MTSFYTHAHLSLMPISDIVIFLVILITFDDLFLQISVRYFYPIIIIPTIFPNINQYPTYVQ